MKKLLLAVGLLVLSVPAFAEDAESASAEDAAFEQWANEFIASLDFQRGVIELPGGIARLDMPEDYVYLNPEDTDRLLSEGWGNPPGTESLGMILPANINPFAYESWGVIVQHVADGYISDEDAHEIDFNALLESMQEDQADENSLRAEEGYEPIEFVGWAEAPRYDAAEHKLYWAQNLRFGDAEENTLNYNVRVLGRNGMLVMNAVANMTQLDAIRGDMRNVLAFSEFTEGNRYEDFNPEIDEVAAYGIGAVVAGKLAAKVGLLAKLGVLLLAFKKFILVFVVAALAFLGKLFKGRLGEKKLE